MQKELQITKRILIAVLTLAGLILACSTTALPLPTPTAGGPMTLEEQLAQIDHQLSQSMSSSFAYNSPEKMTLNDSATIELLMNPSMTAEQLGGQVQESGAVTTGSIDITPEMKAQLIAQDPDAFIIRALHDDPVQVISAESNTRWAWIITAKKSGAQKLTLIIYRLIKYQGQDSWREVTTYQSDIAIQVTFTQWLQSLDWKWVGGIVITALLIPAFWRFVDSRKKKSKGRSK